jgi:hypothetical protein
MSLPLDRYQVRQRRDARLLAFGDEPRDGHHRRQLKEAIVKWKIENSWGGDNGTAGYYVMSQDWFDTFVYQAVILKKYLTPEEELSRHRSGADPSPSLGPDGHLGGLSFL